MRRLRRRYGHASALVAARKRYREFLKALDQEKRLLTQAASDKKRAAQAASSATKADAKARAYREKERKLLDASISKITVAHELRPDIDALRRSTEPLMQFGWRKPKKRGEDRAAA